MQSMKSGVFRPLPQINATTFEDRPRWLGIVNFRLRYLREMTHPGFPKMTRSVRSLGSGPVGAATRAAALILSSRRQAMPLGEYTPLCSRGGFT